MKSISNDVDSDGETIEATKYGGPRPHQRDIVDATSPNTTEGIDDSSQKQPSLWQRISTAIEHMDSGAFGYHDDVLNAHDRRIALLEQRVSDLVASQGEGNRLRQ